MRDVEDDFFEPESLRAAQDLVVFAAEGFEVFAGTLYPRPLFLGEAVVAADRLAVDDAEEVEPRAVVCLVTVNAPDGD